MSNLSNNLENWVTAFKSVKSACATINTNANGFNLNSFAKATVSTLLPGLAQQTLFIQAANRQFLLTGPPGLQSLQGPINTAGTFADLVSDEIIGSLSFCVHDFVQDFCPPNCIDAQSLLLTSTSLTVAFPGGTGDVNWQRLVTAVKASNLDEIVAPGTLAAGATMVGPASVSKLSDLISTLLTL